MNCMIFGCAIWPHGFFDNRGAGGENANVPPFIVASVHQLRRRKTESGVTGGT